MVHLHHFSKIKSHKESNKTGGIQAILSILIDDIRIQIRSRILY
jgi:hypothetical protein